MKMRRKATRMRSGNECAECRPSKAQLKRGNLQIGRAIAANFSDKVDDFRTVFENASEDWEKFKKGIKKTWGDYWGCFGSCCDLRFNVTGVTVDLVKSTNETFNGCVGLSGPAMQPAVLVQVQKMFAKSFVRNCNSGCKCKSFSITSPTFMLPTIHQTVYLHVGWSASGSHVTTKGASDHNCTAEIDVRISGYVSGKIGVCLPKEQ